MAGKLKVINSELIKQVVSSNLIAKIALLYYDLISADNQLLILRQNILLQEQALETIKYQKEIGLANQLAVDRLLGQQNNFLAQEPIISNKIKQLENQLNLLLGKPSGEIRREGRIEEPVRINSFDTIPINLLKNRPDIVAAENNLKASGYLLKSARADFFPSIALNLNFGLNSFNIQSLLNLPASIAGGVFGGITNPIINRKVLKNNFLIKNAERRISWFEYQKLILEGFLELSNLINYEKSISEIIVLKKQEVEILKSASTISKDLLINGKSNYLELISAQQAVLNAEMELNSLKAEQLKNKINFYRALGGGAF
jgi:outer membrane protein TolC